jgi:hypothetical protein
LAFSQFSALEPPLGHLVPCGLARRVASEFSHLLAICGVSQEFLGWMHRVNLPQLHSPIP